MKGKRLLILGAAFALGLSACASAVSINKQTPLKAGDGEQLRGTESMATLIEFNAGVEKGSQTAQGTYTETITKEGVTLTAVNSPMGRTDNYRIYKNQTLTVSLAQGSTDVIRKVEFYCTASGASQYGPGCFAAQTGYSYEGTIGTWIGNQTSVTFTASSNQVRANKIVVAVGAENSEIPSGEEPQVLEVSFAEALAAGKALEHNKTSFDYYQFEGYVTQKDGNNYWMTATQGETVSTDNSIELYFGYNEPSSDVAAKLLKDAKIKITITLKNYNGTVESGNGFAANDVTVLVEGSSWETVPEPAVATKTIAEFKALSNSKALAYSVTGTIQSFKNGSTKDEYGNMTLADGQNELTIYGATMTDSALSWDNISSYSFTNPKDFITNSTSNSLVIGTEITMKLIRFDSGDTIRGAGVITDITVVTPEEIELNPSSLEVVVGKSAPISATILPAGAVADITWTSDDDQVAEVTGSGNSASVSGLEAGSAIITAFIDENGNSIADSSEIYAECEVNVVEPVVPVGIKATLQYTGSSTGNMTETGNASNLNLDDSIFTVNAGKGATTLLPGLNKAHDIRLYNSSEGDGSYFEVVVASGYTILSITIDFKLNAQHAKVYAGDSIVSGDSGDNYSINGESFKIQNGLVSSTSTQVQINFVDIYYQEPAADAIIANKQTQSSLSYVHIKNGGSVEDKLNNGAIGVSGTSYTDWSGKNGTSGATYAGNSAGGNSSIQLRSTNNAGIVTTVSGGKASKVVVSWNSNTASGRTIDIYGSHDAYSSSADLYSADTQGTKLGSITLGSTTLALDSTYEYIGIKSSSGALYLNSVHVSWGEPETFTFSKATIRFGGLLQKALWDELDTESHVIEGYGVMFAVAESLGSNSFENVTPNNTTIFDRYTALSESKLNPTLATAEQKVGLIDADADYYIWNLCINMTDEQYFTDNFIAAAYIKLKNGDKVFMKQTVSTSVKSLAQQMISAGVEDDGSLNYLASL